MGREKKRIMQNQSKLGKLKKKIYIENDLTVQERSVSRMLVKKANNLEARGARIKIGYY